MVFVLCGEGGLSKPAAGRSGRRFAAREAPRCDQSDILNPEVEEA